MATGKFYGQFFMSLANKEVDFDSDQIKGMLVTGAYVFDQDTHRYKSSITSEITGTGYTPGGLVLPTPALSYDAATNQLRFTGGNLAWTGATWTNARGLVLYDNTPATDATRPLIAYVDLGGDTPVTASTFQINWDALGIAYITVA
ncbi:hypothetical protein [Nocardia farcinica]